MIETCHSKKQYVISFFLRGTLISILILILLAIINNEEFEQNETIKAFNNNEEIICFSIGGTKIISKPKGYSFDPNNPNLITNGDAVFHMSKCQKRDKNNGK